MISGDTTWQTIIWRQFGAAIDMLDNAIEMCPDRVWSDRSRRPEVWRMVYHTVFFLDLYLCRSEERFAPPFALDEFHDDAPMPAQLYTRSQMRDYLRHCRQKCHEVVCGMSGEEAGNRTSFSWLEINEGELLLYNLRHVQHHAAQLNLLLRQAIDSAPGWVHTATGG